MRKSLSAVVLLTVLLAATAASAQFREDKVLFTLNAGAIVATSELTDESITGNSGGLTLEKVLADGRFNAGVSVVWLWADAEVEITPGIKEKITYSGVPFMFTGRYNVLNSRFAANIGLGFGMHTSTLKRDEGTIQEKSSTTTGMALSVPIELAYFLDPDFYLKVVYAPTWMEMTPLRDDLSHSLNFGMGFQW